MRTSELLELPYRELLKSVSISVEAPEASEVVVTGDFAHWEREGIRLVKGRSGRWYTSLQLLPGEYQYRLLIDGEWSDHPEAKSRVPNSFGTDNCILVVDE
jgi:1,4-alpha-glucan branching enzyme